MIAAICGPTRWRSTSSASRLGRPQPANTVTQSSLLVDDRLAQRIADVAHLIGILVVEHDDELAIRPEVFIGDPLVAAADAHRLRPLQRRDLRAQGRVGGLEHEREQ